MMLVVFAELLASSESDVAMLNQIYDRLDNLAAEMPNIPKNAHKELQNSRILTNGEMIRNSG